MVDRSGRESEIEAPSPSNQEDPAKPRARFAAKTDVQFVIDTCVVLCNALLHVTDGPNERARLMALKGALESYGGTKR